MSECDELQHCGTNGGTVPHSAAPQGQQQLAEPHETGSLQQAVRRPKGKAAKRRQQLFHWNELPDYLRDNEFIVASYRADTGFWGALRSLFRVHNETGNIWTHLCGAHSQAARATVWARS